MVWFSDDGDPPGTVNQPETASERQLRVASLEKMLVNLICDEVIYGQYQGEELRNICKNANDSYAVDYSQLLEYAAARKYRVFSGKNTTKPCSVR